MATELVPKADPQSSPGKSPFLPFPISTFHFLTMHACTLTPSAKNSSTDSHTLATTIADPPSRSQILKNARHILLHPLRTASPSPPMYPQQSSRLIVSHLSFDDSMPKGHAAAVSKDSWVSVPLNHQALVAARGGGVVRVWAWVRDSRACVCEWGRIQV